MLSKTLFSSEKTDWETPQDFYDKLDSEFHFTCDVAADSSNYKHPYYYDEDIDGLQQPWDGVCWCNPPYGRDIGKWVEKAHMEAQKGVKIVMLIPARTDTRYFHDFIYGKYPIDLLRN